ncbi:hypothetical protein OXYTRIMIC_564 [Oxytricha trifallax]|uniref:Uncharacterized protein n=1 Tax=Oxytricha trifallax TaxID=1172189 RepID=A0A073HYJ4_9SPIT|nr:hypothetical protein OXYTRIMIC_564 [Oxytricha trifallax]
MYRLDIEKFLFFLNRYIEKSGTFNYQSNQLDKSDQFFQKINIQKNGVKLPSFTHRVPTNQLQIKQMHLQTNSKYSLRASFFFKIQLPIAKKNFKIQEKSLLETHERLGNVFQFRDISTDQVYLSIHVKSGAAGLSQGYFSATRYAGKNALDKLKLDARSIGEIEARNLFKTPQKLELMLGDSHKFAELISERSCNGTSKNMISEEGSSLSKKAILKEFIGGVRAGRLSDASDMYEESKGNYDKLIMIGSCENQLRVHQKYLKKIGSGLTSPLPKIEQLMGYIESSSRSDKNQNEICASFLGDCKYYDAVEALYSVIFRRCPEKVNAVWFSGDPDTGKSTLARMVEQIFITERLKEGDANFLIDDSKPFTLPSLVIMNEINHRHFFSKRNIATMKLFLEVEGYPISVKYQANEMKFVGCQVIITSNTTPFEKMERADREAFYTRIKLVNMHQQELNRDGSKTFPFTTIQLAKYFRKRLQEDGVFEGRKQDVKMTEANQDTEDTADRTHDHDDNNNQ